MVTTMSEPLCGWKPSVFNVFHHQGGGWHCFNSRSGTALTLGPPVYRLLRNGLDQVVRNGRCADACVLDLLVEGEFIVPRDLDEYEQEHQRFLRERDCTDWVLLSVVPTFGCNLRCSYCYQAELRRQKPMLDAVREGLVGLAAELISRARGLGVYWFGGEPLTAHFDHRAID